MTAGAAGAGTVGILTTSYPRDAEDPAGRFVKATVKAHVAAGRRVEILAAGEQDAVVARRQGAVCEVRIPFRLPGAAPLFYGAGAPEVLEASGPSLPVVAQGLRFCAGLLREAQARAASWVAIESHWLVPCALVGLAIARGRPHRAHAHSGDVACLERWPLGGTMARALAGSDATLVFASHDLRERFARLARMSATSSAHLVVEPAPIDEARFQDRHADGARESDLVVAVGRLVPIKGFDVLLHAAARLTPTPRLLILGEGPERGRLEALAQRLGLSLSLPGAVAPDVVAHWLARARVYVQPSRPMRSGRTEGTPVATREALAMGAQVIASATGGLRDLATATSAVTLVQPGSAQALAAALRSRLHGASPLAT